MADIPPQHNILIDWISYSAPTKPKHWPPTMPSDGLDHDLELFLGNPWLIMRDSVEKWQYGAGRPPYSDSARTDSGLTLFFNDKLPHALTEISGKGCQHLRDHDILIPVLRMALERLTRVDLAVDLLTATKPAQFVSSGVSARFRTRSDHTSPDGDTYYIGSRKSDRYCRVYRYNKPHPRHKYLRVEYVLKSENARIFVRAMQRAGWDWSTGARALGDTFGFTHPDWNLTGDIIPIEAYAPERREGKTVRWLIAQCGPAFHRLVRSGVIADPEAFLYDYFLHPKTEDDQ